MYAQIVEQIEGLVKKGALHPGDRLPPERDLARKLVVARGTVKKAYELLEQRRLVEGTQGRGTFVASSRPDATLDRRERALGVLTRALDACEDLSFSPGEILTWCQLLVHRRQEARAEVNALALDCNPEALVAFSLQLQHQLGIAIHGRLLPDLFSCVNPVEACEPYDMILVPATHFDEVATTLAALRSRLVQVALAPTHVTIGRFGALPEAATVAVASRSRTFFDIVCRWMGRLSKNTIPPRLVELERLPQLDLRGLHTLILPPGAWQRPADVQFLARAARAGVQILPFEYQVEQGSIIHLQSLIKLIVQQRLES
jgi:DNA-binding transcriptional regulator YhcF (GntR family)